MAVQICEHANTADMHALNAELYGVWISSPKTILKFIWQVFNGYPFIALLRNVGVRQGGIKATI